MEHDLTVEWSPETLSGVELPPGWSCRRLGDKTWTASGPCPACGGDAFGPPLMDPGDFVGEPSDLRPLTDTEPDIDTLIFGQVSCECRCGHTHGKDGKTGCGRSWVVTCRTEADT